MERLMLQGPPQYRLSKAFSLGIVSTQPVSRCLAAASHHPESHRPGGHRLPTTLSPAVPQAASHHPEAKEPPATARPRRWNKMDCVDFYFNEIYKGEASREIERVSSLLYDLLVEYIDRKSRVPEVEKPTFGTSSTDPSLSQNMPFEEDCQDRFAVHKKSKKRKINLRSELDHYLQEDVMPNIAHFDILDFWKKDFKYPTLRMLARDILAIPVSTVASESAFSMGGRVVGPHRSRLHAKTVEALMCLQNWMIGGMKVTKLESAYAIAAIFDNSDSNGGATSEIIDPDSECDFGLEAC